MAAAAAGDVRAFEALYRAHLPKIHSLVRRMTAGRDVDELTQDVFVRAWQKLGTFRGASTFGTWLHRLAVNVVIERFRSDAVRQRRLHDDESIFDRLPALQRSGDLAMDFEAAIARLPDGARRIFVLHDVHGYKHHEIATLLGLSPGTSKAQLHRARMMLRRGLEARKEISGLGVRHMTDPFTDLLSDYLDDEELPLDERHRIEKHLGECAECRATLAELREVTLQASTLVDTPPMVDLWPGVAARIGGIEQPPLRTPQKPAVLPMRSAARRFSFTVPQLVAAGLALMLLSGGTVWLARMGGQRTDFQPLSATQRTDSQLTDVRAVDAYYDQAIAELQRTMDAGRGRLDPATLRVLETNLQAIDRAIEQCRAALASDPGSVYLSTHLANAQRRKLTLLRRATALVAAQS